MGISCREMFMARNPGKGPLEYIHVPSIVYWMGFWFAGIYFPLLVFALFELRLTLEITL